MNSDSAAPENDSNLSGLGRALLGTNEGSKPTGPWVPPTAEELHQILPQYEIVKMLGRGGMGAVYMGTQTALDRPVAIKILSAALEDSDAGFAERFKNEARAMAKLNHPGIVSVYDFGEAAGGLLYIVMEYVDGTDVAKMIAGKGRLHTEHAMAITAHVCDALAYAHERGIIHRDIKPANIMVGYDGTVKVADFGLAKVNMGGNTLGLTQSGMAMGTLHYMAPEALMLGVAVDHRADIYAVGVMLYQMLTGKLPQGMFKMPSLTVPGLDPRYDAIIAKGMMEDREARYQSARDLRGDLDGILTQPVVKLEAEAAQPASALPTQARPQRPGGPRPQSYRPPQPAIMPRTEKKASLLPWTLVLLLLCGGGYLYLNRAAPKPQASEAPTHSTPPAQAAQGGRPTGSTAKKPARQDFLIDKAFLDDFIRGSRWQTEYADSHDEDTLVFAMTGNGVQKSSGTRHEQAAEWSVSPDGATLKVVMKESSDSIMHLRFQTNSLADIEFQRAGAPLLTGKIKRETSAPKAEVKPATAPPVPQPPSIQAATQPSPAPPASPMPAVAGPPATPTLWINTQGRSLQASFVRVEGSNVVLNIAGKATTVALATLSTASQQIAQQLQAAMPDAGNASEWLVGQWHQTNDGKSFPIFLLELKSGGDASFAGGNLRTTGRWSYENKAVTIAWANGARYHVDVPSNTPSASLDGIIFDIDGKAGSRTHVRLQRAGAGADANTNTGWTPLFPNDSLSGWTGDVSTHRIANGILVSSGRGDLISPKEYGNFHLKFDLRLAPGTNNGLGIWRTGAAGATANATQGFEVQIQDDTAAKFKSAEYWQRHCGIYYFREPAALPMGPVGSWNTHEIRVEGTQLEVTINGRSVQKTDLTTLRPIVTRAPVLNISSRRGHLAFLGREGAAEFRNMQIKELP